jgi:hypothetical protein
MRPFLLVVWCLVPIGAVGWHYGPGQDFMHMDDADGALRSAQQSVAAGQWTDAIDAYDDALKSIPPGRVNDIRRVRLERAKALLNGQRLPDAHRELIALADELQDVGAPQNSKLFADTRSALASAQYYTTWLMRLEGEPTEIWEKEIESSRQTYKLLLDQAKNGGDTAAAKTHQEDLEAAIRLERMDLADLQALKLPSQCRGCCEGCCNGRGKCKGKGRGPASRSDQDSRGAGGEMMPDTRGS